MRMRFIFWVGPWLSIFALDPTTLFASCDCSRETKGLFKGTRISLQKWLGSNLNPKHSITHLWVSPHFLSPCPSYMPPLFFANRLTMSHNSIRTLPLQLNMFTSLRYLNIRANSIRIFPAVVRQMGTLLTHSFTPHQTTRNHTG